ncbi:hypothetical protein [Cyclobacterium amurskyense]|uniref:Glycoside hydrolase family 5 domain-containing protein n=1 Tax=Cyclobacterium amurskyense TaxID=320787 RepID=A0A0H4PAJ0_9BACT|nr:hypothetical protein [Cyclobacterium amurskyense]AKP49773.1 hypothetical protein CA2015_0293 [Cyclobacterium amurskyense]
MSHLGNILHWRKSVSTLMGLLILFSFSHSYSQTKVKIKGEKFYINGKPTYAGQKWKGLKIEGLLMNARMVQGVFDDLNPETIERWKYPDTGKWDADRNTSEFVQHMNDWKAHGLLSFTINLQGGSPEGYSKNQPWHNSAFTAQGELRPAYMARLKKVLDEADRLEMVPILGLFYFGQDHRLENEAAVIKAVDLTINWLHDHNYKNVIIEINNECNVRYVHKILQPERVHELILRAKSIERNGYRYYVSTSYGGRFIPLPNVVQAADFILIHGNGVAEPKMIEEMVAQTRAVKGYHKMPILFNEDDHFDFDKDYNNMIASVSSYASWGYFDFRMKDDGFEEGYQSMPVDWSISSDRKRGFFNLLKEITGY